MKKQLLLASALAMAVVSTASATTVFVDATQFFNQTGIDAMGSEQFSITATGTAELSRFNGSYQTDPDGVITFVSAPGTGAYEYFNANAGPVGVAPVIGLAKTILGGGALNGAPYGGLVAGFSASPSPTSFGDFPDGFQWVGSSGTITAPVGGGYLFLSVNDINNDWDNGGGFTAEVASVGSVPESACTLSLMLVAFGLLGTVRSACRRLGSVNP
jgi:hypothetical protein